MKIKDRHILNSSNESVIKSKRKSTTIFGKFSIDKNNRLIYWSKEPVFRLNEKGLSKSEIFDGKWKLNKDYDLELHLNNGDTILLRSKLISPEANVLVFEVLTRDRQGNDHFQILKLSGFWQADKYNRLNFLVKKNASPDTLTLKGEWQVNKNQQLTYTYEKMHLKTKLKAIHSMVFEGFWQINEKNRLGYILSEDSNSYFDFRVALETPNLYPQEKKIKYRLGIGVKGSSIYIEKIVSLIGAWKFKRKLGLSFQVDYGKEKVKAIEFAVDAYLTKKDKITFSLKNRINQLLGMNVIFSHSFLKRLDAQAFFRIKAKRQELGIESGVNIPF